MATDYLLPDLGEDIEEAEVIAVHVRAGDHVELEQAVIEVETEKANLDVPAPYAGAITAVHVSVGDMVKPGQAIVTIEGEDGAEPAAPAAAATPAPAAGAPPPFAAPTAPSAQLRPRRRLPSRGSPSWRRPCFRPMGDRPPPRPRCGCSRARSGW